MNIWKILFLFTYNRLKTLQTIEYNPRIKGVLDEMEGMIRNPEMAEKYAKLYDNYLMAQREELIKGVLPNEQ